MLYNVRHKGSFLKIKKKDLIIVFHFSTMSPTLTFFVFIPKFLKPIEVKFTKNFYTVIKDSKFLK